MEEILTKQLVFMASLVVGQIMMVLIPYFNKSNADGRKFDFNYAYTAVLGYVIMAVTMLQTDAIMSMELTFSSVMILMFGGAVVQREVVAKLTPKKKAL